ncbi:MAG TPA: phosphatidylinositol mannoside acyltransferase [Mycobacteriales bacterium]|nr:phosphatidylinositol mannoside acyltransferase [Mycobacteriales bacterium]
MSLVERVADSGYAAGWRVVRGLPAAVVRPVFRRGADLAARREGAGTRQLRRNLRRVVGPDLSEAELDVLVRDALRSYARYWLEAFRLPSVPPDEVVATMRIDGVDLLDRCLAEGRGTIVALSHSGNWDHAGAWAAYTGRPVTTVAERLKPESLYDRFVAYRESIGITVLPLTGGRTQPLDALTARLRAGGLVCLLADRDLSRRGIDVEFFGGRTRMPGGPALLSLRTGAPLLAARVWYDGPYTRTSIVGPVQGDDVATMTQAVADELAQGIAAHPQDWHMLQRMWVES